MQLKIWIAAALVALAGCSNQGGQGQADAGAAAELRAAADDPKLARFYEARGWQPDGRTRRDRERESLELRYMRQLV